MDASQLGALRAGELSLARWNYLCRYRHGAQLFVTSTLQAASRVVQVKVLGGHTLRVRTL